MVRESSTCVNYAKINNSVLHMRGHISAGFFDGFCHIVASASNERSE